MRDSFFEGFDLGTVVDVRVRSYTLGPGGSAQLVSLGLEVRRQNSVDPETIEIDFESDGPTLATARAVVTTLNRRLRERRGEAR